MAALWRLPVLFVCINNQYGMGTRIDNATAAPDLHKRAAPFGLEGANVDGGDVEAVSEIACNMISNARAGKPGFLVVDCYRFYGHARMDKSPYRDDTEEAEGRLRDPVIRARQTLISRGEMDDDSLDELDQNIAQKWTQRSPLPRKRANLSSTVFLRMSMTLLPHHQSQSGAALRAFWGKPCEHEV